MKRFGLWCALAFLAVLALGRPSGATTLPVFYNTLTASATVATPLGGGDTLFVDTLVTTEIGPLLQTTTFTLAAGVVSVEGHAAWEVTSSTSTGPRLIGVNIDIFDATNTLIYTDSFLGLLGAFAISDIGGAIGPGTYTLVATGTGVRTSSLDISLTFAAVPEPSVLLLSAAGLLGLGVFGRRRSA